MPQIGESTNGVQETPKLNGTSFILLFPIGVLMWFNFAFMTIQNISIVQVPHIAESAMDFKKVQSLVELDLSCCFELGCLHLSFLKIMFKL